MAAIGVTGSSGHKRPCFSSKPQKSLELWPRPGGASAYESSRYSPTKTARKLCVLTLASESGKETVSCMLSIKCSWPGESCSAPQPRTSCARLLCQIPWALSQQIPATALQASAQAKKAQPATQLCNACSIEAKSSRSQKLQNSLASQPGARD